ncbi:MAG: MT-A70 family methyltransferase [Alphaproteobacteria bacterium]|nr:MT-A70 family methyltransferase [Gammaproteobacteria bacterium]MDA8009745.1 MT-A70 family methyltransferase [Alphaproteobacteria bacterium]MDA8030398.1 MT-A70 family methyltransferase [Alphaproteobacteria bacterium]
MKKLSSTENANFPAREAGGRAVFNGAGDFPAKKYRCIVVDPPWNQGKTGKRSVRPRQGCSLDYATMRLEEIKSVPVHDWARSNSFLWLWATNSKDKNTKRPVLSMAFELLEWWGFTFHTMITWNKKTGPCPFSPYQVVTEHVLFGWRGKAQFDPNRLGKMKTVFHETSTRHSVKPASFYEHIRQSFSGPRLDVFARQKHKGFDGWGNEYQK